MPEGYGNAGLVVGRVLPPGPGAENDGDTQRARSGTCSGTRNLPGTFLDGWQGLIRGRAAQRCHPQYRGAAIAHGQGPRRQGSRWTIDVARRSDATKVPAVSVPDLRAAHGRVRVAHGVPLPKHRYPVMRSLSKGGPRPTLHARPDVLGGSCANPLVKLRGNHPALCKAAVFTYGSDSRAPSGRRFLSLG